LLKFYSSIYTAKLKRAYYEVRMMNEVLNILMQLLDKARQDYEVSQSAKRNLLE